LDEIGGNNGNYVGYDGGGYDGGGYGNSGYYGGNQFADFISTLEYLLGPKHDPSYYLPTYTGKPTPYPGTSHAKSTPANLAKPVGTGASTVYSGGGKKSQGNSSDQSNNSRGYVISYLNGTAAYGAGLTGDVGIVIDATGQKKSYFTIGVTGGIGESAGQGLFITNKKFRVNDLGGESVNLNIPLPILKFLSFDFFGDSNKFGLSKKGDFFPGKHTRGFGLNYGVGGGVFMNWTYTFIFEAPDIDYMHLPSLSHGR